MRTPNKRARDYILGKENILGHNLYAYWRPGIYCVFSYRESYPIQIYDKEKDIWYINNEKYSRTTSRHQSIARPPESDAYKIEYVSLAFLCSLIHINDRKNGLK
jgi:hypothetical protein